MEKQTKEKEKDTSIALIPTTDKKRFCNICNTQLLSDYQCPKCAIYYRPEEARHETKIIGLDGREPGPNTDKGIPIAVQDPYPKKEKKMSALFESLKKSGFRFTSYSETNT